MCNNSLIILIVSDNNRCIPQSSSQQTSEIFTFSEDTGLLKVGAALRNSFSADSLLYQLEIDLLPRRFVLLSIRPIWMLCRDPQVSTFPVILKLPQDYKTMGK